MDCHSQIEGGSKVTKLKKGVHPPCLVPENVEAFGEAVSLLLS